MNKQEKIDAWTLFHSLFKEGEEVWLITDEDDFIWGELLEFNDEECALYFRGRKVWFRWDCIRFISHDGFPVRSLTGADGSRSILKEQNIIFRVLDEDRYVYGKGDKTCPYCKHIESYVKSEYFTKNKKYQIECARRKNDRVPEWNLSGWGNTSERVGCNLFEASGKKMRLAEAPVDSGGDDDGGNISLGRSTSSFGDPFLIEGAEMILLNLGNRGERFEDDDHEEVIVCEAKDGAKALLYDLDTVYYLGSVA